MANPTSSSYRVRTVKLPKPHIGGHGLQSLRRPSAVTPEFLRALGYTGTSNDFSSGILVAEEPKRRTLPRIAPPVAIHPPVIPPSAAFVQPLPVRPHTVREDVRSFFSWLKHIRMRAGVSLRSHLLALERHDRLLRSRLLASVGAARVQGAALQQSKLQRLFANAAPLAVTIFICSAFLFGMIRDQQRFLAAHLELTHAMEHADLQHAKLAIYAAEAKRLSTAMRAFQRRRESPHAKPAPSLLRRSLPSIDPSAGGEITSGFGWREYPSREFHEGVDLAVPYGHPVLASADGRVVGAGWAGGYGRRIEIDHGRGYQTWYAHLSRIDVVVGQAVQQGETIAAVGMTGYTTGPHLHYQIMYHGEPINPVPFLHGVPADIAARRE